MVNQPQSGCNKISLGYAILNQPCPKALLLDDEFRDYTKQYKGRSQSLNGESGSEPTSRKGRTQAFKSCSCGVIHIGLLGKPGKGTLGIYPLVN